MPRRLPPRMLDQAGALDGQGLVWDDASQLYLPDDVVRSIVPGSGVTVDDTDPLNPVVSAAGGGSSSVLVYPFISGKYYTDPAQPVTSLTTTTPVAGRLEFRPFPVDVTTTFDQLAIECTATGTSKYRIGIYDSSAAGLPNHVVANGGQVGATAGGAITATISATLTPGLYWLAWLSDVVGTGAFRSSQQQPSIGRLGWTAVVGGAAVSELIATGVAAGALPDPAPTPTTSGTTSSLRMFVRAA